MTNKEFFRELKSKGVKIINSSKNNAATWMFLEKESFDPEAIFSQKTISRANYFLLDKKWLVSALEKFKEKMEAAVVAEEKEDVLLNFQRVYKNAFLNKKIKQVKMYLELLKTQMLEKSETDVFNFLLMNCLNDFTEKKTRALVRSQVWGEELLAFEFVDYTYSRHYINEVESELKFKFSEINELEENFIVLEVDLEEETEAVFKEIKKYNSIKKNGILELLKKHTVDFTEEKLDLDTFHRINIGLKMLETNEEQLKSRIKSQLLELRSEEFKTLENGKLKIFAKNNKNKKEASELFEKTKDHIIYLEKRNIEKIFYLSEQEPKELYKKIKEFINREEK